MRTLARKRTGWLTCICRKDNKIHAQQQNALSNIQRLCADCITAGHAPAMVTDTLNDTGYNRQHLAAGNGGLGNLVHLQARTRHTPTVIHTRKIKLCFGANFGSDTAHEHTTNQMQTGQG